MRISIVTLFPDLFVPLISSSIIAKARKEGKLRVDLIDLREFGIGSHRQVDSRVYGGGVGMILRVEPIHAALKQAGRGRKVLLTPQGKTLDQAGLGRLSKEKRLILVCGKYEGVDERVRELVDEELSIGDYVLSGGEIPAMAVLDGVARLLPGVLEEEATESESFSEGRLEPPQYTRPEVYKGMRVPEVLLSGNHGEIERWRKEQAEKKTRERRPDLLKE